MIIILIIWVAPKYGQHGNSKFEFHQALLAGYLGAGKTTLLVILTYSYGKRVAVIVS